MAIAIVSVYLWEEKEEDETQISFSFFFLSFFPAAFNLLSKPSKASNKGHTTKTDEGDLTMKTGFPLYS